MEQHPVPQNISSYEFRLVGDMTLKQFFQLAGGVLVGIIFYQLPLPFIIKWPLIGLAAITGICLAFVPVNGRPFSQWVLAFIRAIYSPTEYAWRSTPSVPLEDTPAASTSAAELHSPLDILESQVVSRISGLFNSGSAPSAPPSTPPPARMVPEVVSEPAIQAPAIPIPISKLETTASSSTVWEARKPIMVAEVVQSVPAAPQAATPPPAVAPQSVVAAPAPSAPPVTPVVAHTPPPAAAPAATASQLPTPERPNLVSGLVKNTSNQGIEGVIVEVTDSNTGIPVRALKTNRLGQFQTATPLNNGRYVIAFDKEGMIFDPVSVSMEGDIVQPMLITAKA